MAWRKIQQDQLVDPRFVSMPAESQNLFIRIQCFSDAHGRIGGHPLTIQHRLVLVGWTPTDTAQHLTMLYDAGLIDWYGTTPSDCVIQVVGFDDTQGWQLIRSRGESTIVQRGSNHIDGPDLFPELVQHHRSTSAAPPQHHNSTTAVSQLPRVERERRDLYKAQDWITKIELVFQSSTQLLDHKFNDRDLKRLEQVTSEYTLDVVTEYLQKALKAKYFWDQSKGKSRRKNAIPTLFNVKKDKAGRTYHQKIRGAWPDPQTKIPQTEQDQHLKTLRGDWS